MILFTILMVIAFILLTFVVLTTAIGGATFVIIFADVIVCIWIIVMIMKHVAKKKR